MATLNIVFTITYYLESHDAINMYLISCFCINKGQCGCLDVYEISTSSLGKDLHSYLYSSG